MFLVGILVACLASIAYAYWASMPLPTPGPTVSITSPPLQFSMGLDKAEYAPIDNFTVHFSLRNISNQTVTLTVTSILALGINPMAPIFRVETSSEGVTSSELSIAFHFGFRWTYSNGTVVFDTGHFGRFHSTYNIVLAPGGCLNQIFHLSLVQYYGKPPVTGVFQIRGFFPYFYVDGSGPPTATLETPSIAFTAN